VLTGQYRSHWQRCYVTALSAEGLRLIRAFNFQLAIRTSSFEALQFLTSENNRDGFRMALTQEKVLRYLPENRFGAIHCMVLALKFTEMEYNSPKVITAY
jgi:hypothetical protein